MMLWITTAILSVLAYVAVDCAESQRPHIIFILVDDLGWDDVSFHGSDQILTPNMDALAYNGIILNNYYIQPICTPSRASLMTGRYVIHTGMQHGVIMGAQPFGLGLNETLLPQYLKTMGYATHIVGKWHLGFFHKEYTPTYRGFDSHYGYWLGREDYYTHKEKEGKFVGLDFRRNMEADNTTYGDYSTDLYREEAVKLIKNHDPKEPLFLYLPFQSVHGPFQAPEDYVKRFPKIENKGRRVYAGMMAALDDAIGQIVNQLHGKGMLENSVIMFSADNGGPTREYAPASNFPLRGGKYTFWEGGVKGTGFIYSPMLKKQQRVSNQMMHLVDWLPTILHAAGGNSSNLTMLDGVDMWDALSKDEASPRTEVVHNIDASKGYAVRVGDYKIVYFKCCDGGYQYNHWYTTPQFEKDGTWNETIMESRDNDEPDEVSMPEYLKFPSYSNLQEKGNAFNQRSSSNWDHYFKSKKARESSIRHILKSPIKFMDSRIVECGPVPSNASQSCNVNKETCLFNIREDPCEYHNLAKERPDILAILMDKMKAYRATAVPIRNKKDSPESNPALHGGIWTNYADKTMFP